MIGRAGGRTDDQSDQREGGRWSGDENSLAAAPPPFGHAWDMYYMMSAPREKGVGENLTKERENFGTD